MDEDLDLFVGQTKEPVGFDDLKPLFIKVAESMVIFAPISQLGCLRASLGVTSSSCSLVYVRKGPPEAG